MLCILSGMGLQMVGCGKLNGVVRGQTLEESLRCALYRERDGGWSGAWARVRTWTICWTSTPGPPKARRCPRAIPTLPRRGRAGRHLAPGGRGQTPDDHLRKDVTMSGNGRAMVRNANTKGALPTVVDATAPLGAAAGPG